MPDISQLSDDDLRALASGGGSAAPSISDLSDDELRALAAPKTGGFLNDEDKVAGRAARLVVQGIPRALGGAAALVGDVGINAGKAMFNAGRRSVGGPEIDNPPLPLSTALANSTERWATQLGLPEMPKEGIPGYLGRGAEVATEALTGAGLANLAARGVRAVAPAAARGIESLAARPVQQVVAGLGGQAGSEAAGYLAPDSMAARLIGAGLGTVGGIGATAAIPAAGRFADRALLRGEAVPDEVARRVRAAAVDPERAVQDLSRPSINAPGGPTAAQQSGDLGLIQLERDAQTQNPVPFTARREEQAAARNRALEGVQPEGQGNVSDLTDFVRQQLRAEDELAGAVEGGARERARGAAEAIAPTETEAKAVGRNIREPIAEADASARARTGRLYEAVDPDGTLTVGTQGIREAVNKIYDRMSATARDEIVPGEERVLSRLETYGPDVSFRELVDLDKNIDKHRRAAIRDRGPEYARLVQLKGAVRDALSTGAAERIAADPSVAERIRGMRDEFEAGTGARDSGLTGENAAVRSGAVPLPRDAEGAGVGGSGGAARPGSVQAAPGRPKKGLTLSQFIARNGGLALDDEAAARDFGNVTVPGVGGKLARPNGKSIDGFWRNKLIDEGYLPPDADGGASRDITKELYDALEAERAGRVTRTAADERNLPAEAPDDEGAAHAAAVAQIRDEWKRAGMRENELSSRALQDAAERVARGEETNGLNAYERAVMALDDEPTPRPSYPEVPEPPGGFPNALGGYRRDPEAGTRYQAATTAARERKERFGSGAPGAMLRESGTRGNYRMSDASVTANAFRPGVRGGERIAELVAAGAPESAIADAAALSLSKHVREGVLDPAGFVRWRQQHEAAFAALPEDVRARFANASLASEALGAATGRRREAAAAAQRSALGRLIATDEGDLPNRFKTILNSPNANREVGQLLATARRDPAALEGLRRGVADEIARRVNLVNKESGASGEAVISGNKLGTLLRDRRGVLVQVFGEPHVQTLEAIAEDIQRAERSTSGGVKIPGGSNTAQDTRLDRAARAVNEHGLWGNILRRGGLGAAAGGFKGAAFGAAAGALESGVGSLRAAGLRRVNDLLVETIMDPALARAALVRGRGASNAQKAISARLLAKYANPAAAAAGRATSEDSE